MKQVILLLFAAWTIQLVDAQTRVRKRIYRPKQCLIDCATGCVLSKVSLAGSHENLEFAGNRLYVTVYNDNIYEYDIKN